MENCTWFDRYGPFTSCMNMVPQHKISFSSYYTCRNRCLALQPSSLPQCYFCIDGSVIFTPFAAIIMFYYPILATKQQIKNALNPSASMADFRFKGYVNDFMVSPRNPITQSMAGKWTQKKTTNSFLNGGLFVVP